MLTWWYWDAWRWTGVTWEPLGNRSEFGDETMARRVGLEMAKQNFPAASLNRCFTRVGDAWQECPAG